MTTFNEVTKKNLAKLEQFVPIVDRVHGGSHPEFHDVRKVFEQISTKIKASGNKKPALADDFKQLREITSNYLVPGDVCESYEAVYLMLSELDKAYQA